MARFLLTLIFALGCGLDLSAVPPTGGADAARDAEVADSAPRDSSPTDSGERDAPADVLVGDADAGRPGPTSVVTTPGAGGQGSQPAVLYDGGEFVIGLIADGHVELLRMAPGRVTSARERVTTELGVGLEDVLLALDGGRLAVGWTEDRAGSPTLMARVLPDDAAPRVVRSGLFRERDRQDAALYGTGSGFGAIFRDESSPGFSRLQYVSLDGGAPVYLAGNLGSLGELDVRPSPIGALFSTGRPQIVYLLDGTTWNITAAPILGDGSEGTVAPLLDGTIASVWLHAPLAGTGRVLSFVRHRPNIVWLQVGSTRQLSVEGSDPALAPFGSDALMAFVYADGEDRTLGLAVIDPTGNFVAGPCRVAPIAPVANDPDLACAAGWCAIAWMEASAYDATDYVTRVIQVPVDHDLLCP